MIYNVGPQITEAHKNVVKGKEEELLYPETEEGNKADEEPKQKLCPARTKVRRWDPNERVDLAIGESGIEAEEPITVGQLFKSTAEKLPDHPALEYKQDGIWKPITYTHYYDHCIRAAKSFLKVRVHVSCV